MFNKIYFSRNYKILFFFKFFPFLYEKDQLELLNYIIVHFFENNDLFYNKKLYYFVFYFIKNWYLSSNLNYIELPDHKFKFKTNNKVELFNKKLNSIIEHIRPKFSFFINKYKILIKESYNNYIDYLKNIDIEQNVNNNIANDIINFIYRLINKYKCSIGYKILSQLRHLFY